MNLSSVHRVHMLGIGGIGMSALARYFLKQGMKVSGYDRTPSEMTKALEAEGAEVHFEDDPELIPSSMMEERKEKALVVRSLAIDENNGELQFLKERGFPVKDRAQVLGTVARGYKCIAVAGTHGKTTTGSVLAGILKDRGVPCHALLGGISADFGSNVLLEGDAEHLVVEADEYGRSFLELEPQMAIITAMEADHLDVYGNEQGLRDAFFEFQERVDHEGHLFLEESVPKAKEAEAPVIRFGRGAEVDVRLLDPRPEKGRYAFDLAMHGEEWKGLSSKMPGLHNALDLSAALAVAYELGVDETGAREALQKLRGVRRRFEFVHEEGDRVLIDDYAHHPTELKAVIRTARELYPDKRITGVFQPHLYSRTQDHLEGFAEALAELDELILLPIYPAREKAIPGVESGLILEKVQGPRKELIEKGELKEKVREWDPGVLLVLGAGDVADEVKGLSDLMDELTEKEKGTPPGS